MQQAKAVTFQPDRNFESRSISINPLFRPNATNRTDNLTKVLSSPKAHVYYVHYEDPHSPFTVKYHGDPGAWRDLEKDLDSPPVLIPEAKAQALEDYVRSKIGNESCSSIDGRNVVLLVAGNSIGYWRERDADTAEHDELMFKKAMELRNESLVDDVIAVAVMPPHRFDRNDTQRSDATHWMKNPNDFSNLLRRVSDARKQRWPGNNTL